MRLFKQLILMVAIAMLPALANAATPKFGRYLGTLTNERLKQDQMVRLDFVPSRVEGNRLLLKAVLVLYFGDYTSDEYVSYHYDQVSYDLLTSQLIFDQADQDVQVVVDRMADAGIQGSLRSAVGGAIGTLNLSSEKPVAPKLPLVRKLEGEYYSAKCEESQGWMTLHTFKSTNDTSRVGNPFGGNEIRGQMAYVDRILCGDLQEPGKGSVCVRSQISGGSYDFFRGKLSLKGHPRPVVCTVKSGSLSCSNGCQYNKASKESLTQLQIPEVDSKLDVTSTGAVDSTLEGDYSGYIFHERLGIYQKLQVQLSTYRKTEGGASTLYLSAASGISFGDDENGEVLPYKFSPIPISNPFGIKDLLFSREADDVDALMRVNSIQDGVIRGEWFSIIYGKIGSFVVTKSEGTKVTLPPGAKLMSNPAGRYSDRIDWDLDLDIFMDRTPPNTENPFFPMTFIGFIRGIGGFTANMPVTGGSYDFYTGKLAVFYDDERVLVGKQTPGDLRLRIISKGFGTRYFGMTERRFHQR